MSQYDVAIIGGGPGGSTLGTYLAQAGKKVALIEKKEFPRFQIGESLLPYSMEIFREIGFEEELSKSDKYLEKYGAEFFEYQSLDRIRFDFTLDGSADWPMAYEVNRAEFDNDLLEYAKKSGVEVLQPLAVKDVDIHNSGVSVKTTRGPIEAKFLADASGRSSFIGRKLGIRKINKDINNVGVFSHFKNVKRKSGKLEGDITIVVLPEVSWAWIIPFKDGTASVGVVSSSDTFKRFSTKKELFDHFVQSCPLFKDSMAEAEPTGELQSEANYSQTCDQFYDARWIMLGDAAQFLDPIFSSGVHISLNSAKSASRTLIEALNTDSDLLTNGRGESYEQELRLGLKRFHGLLNIFYSSNWVQQMNKVFETERMYEAFTKALAGGVWDESNPLFRLKVV